MLRAGLRYVSVDSEIRTLLVTSALGGGKATTSRRLADTMAAMGDAVVLVEADMHRGGQGGPVGGGEEQGLSGYLIDALLDDVLIDVRVGSSDTGRSLTLLPSGPLPPNPTELLESNPMHQLMDELQDRFDMVIIDNPPLPVLSDAVTLLGHVSGIVLVAAVGVTTDKDIDDVVRLMDLHGSAVLGVVASFDTDADRLKGYYGESRETRHRQRLELPRRAATPDPRVQRARMTPGQTRKPP